MTEPDGFSLCCLRLQAQYIVCRLQRNEHTLALLAAGKRTVSQTCLPVLLSNAHNCLSAAPLINTSPPAVTIGPERANKPVFGPPSSPEVSHHSPPEFASRILLLKDSVHSRYSKGLS